MTSPIASLVATRLRRRGGQAALLVLAVAAAVALIAVVLGVALVAADAALKQTLATTGDERPVVAASRFEPSGGEVDRTDTFAAIDGRMREAFRGVDAYAADPVAGVLFAQLTDLGERALVQVVAIDDPDAWTELLEGRPAAPCDGRACEAILLSEAPAPEGLTSVRPAPDLELTIVGRGLLTDAVPFLRLDQRGPAASLVGEDQQVGDGVPTLLLVRGIAGVAASGPLERAPRSYFWTAPIDPATIHPWTADDFSTRVAELARVLGIDDDGTTVRSPVSAVDLELSRAEIGRGRLLLLGSLGVAILLAFVVFAALVGKPDVLAEHRRLIALGARRRQRIAFLVLEAAVPSVVGGLLGWLGGALVIAVVAVSREVDPLAAVGGSLGAPAAVAVGLGVVVAAVGAILAATAPGIPRGSVLRFGASAALTAGLILTWQLVASGALSPSDLGETLASPLVVLLPPVVAFLVALAVLMIVPPVLRRLARMARRAPLPVRLSLLSVARDADRPAATLTLLAFSLGAIVFTLGYAASLERGIADQAAFRSGEDLRVVELGTGLSISQSVVPTDRYDALGGGVHGVPVLRTAGEVEPDGRVEILALPAEDVGGLRGWRSDFSSLSAAQIGERIEMPGSWAVAGQRLLPEEDKLRIQLRFSGSQVRLAAVVGTAGGDYVRVDLGTITERTTEATAPLPTAARGGLLTALIFTTDRLIAGSGHEGELDRATITIENVPDLVAPEPIQLEVFTTSATILRAPQPTDGLAIPAVVSPDLAAEAGPDGRLPLQVGTEKTVELHVVGTADRFPGLLDVAPRFVLVDLEPFLVAYNGQLPGAGRPTEMWLRLDDPAAEATVRARLAEPPFRYAQLTSRAELVAARSSDPLSEATVWALVVAAFAGLVLAIGGIVLGAAADLRDEAGELADLEAQGFSPRALLVHILTRTAWLAGGGVIGGLVVGVLLTHAVTGTLAVTADGSTPIPSLATIVPAGSVVLIVVGVLAAAFLGVGLMAARTYGGRSLGERRSGRASGATVPAVEGDGRG